MPSLLEGLPLALLEAMNHRLPVIVSDIPPHVEVVGADGVGHRVFPANDVDGLTRAFERTLDDLPLSSERRGELEQRVAEEYSWDRITSLTEDVYLQAVQRASRGSPHLSSLPQSLSG